MRVDELINLFIRAGNDIKDGSKGFIGLPMTAETATQLFRFSSYSLESINRLLRNELGIELYLSGNPNTLEGCMGVTLMVRRCEG